MTDCLTGLWHHLIVCCNYNNRYISYLSTSRTHGGKSLVTRGVQKCYFLSVFKFYIIGTNVLGNPSGFPGNYIGFSYVVQQRCFTVVYVSHYCYDGSAAD